jgi:hypothetical protein
MDAKPVAAFAKPFALSADIIDDGRNNLGVQYEVALGLVYWTGPSERGLHDGPDMTATIGFTGVF